MFHTPNLSASEPQNVAVVVLLSTVAVDASANQRKKHKGCEKPIVNDGINYLLYPRVIAGFLNHQRRMTTVGRVDS